MTIFAGKDKSSASSKGIPYTFKISLFNIRGNHQLDERRRNIPW